MTTSNAGLLSGLSVIESSVVFSGFADTFPSDLGAEVIKVEPPAGDYIQKMTWPIVDGDRIAAEDLARSLMVKA